MRLTGVSLASAGATSLLFAADEALIPARVALDDKTFDRIVTLLEAPAAPTAALREGLLVSEPLPMVLGIETITTALAP